MQLLIALFEVYKAILTYLREIYWNLLLRKSSKFLLKPHKQVSFWIQPKGFVTKLVYLNSPFIKYRRSFEYKVFEKINQVLSPGDTAIDVGANVGILSLFMNNLVGKNGHIYSIEASSKNAEIFTQNVKLNNIENITIINKAVSDEPGTVFLVPPHENYNDALLVISDSPKKNAETVEAIPFDTIAQTLGINSAKLIKIDIEGAELLFFKGAQQFLLKHKPFLIFESLEAYTHRLGYSVTDVIALLLKLDYKLIQLDQETWFATHKTKIQ